MIRASSLPRLVKCIGGAVLPTVNEESSEYAADGTAMHAYLAAVLCGQSPEVAVERVPEHLRERCAAIPWGDILPSLPTTVPSVEAPYLYDPDTGDAWECANYKSAYPRHIGGTLDVAWSDAECPVVVDWKSGHQWVEHPRTNPQLRAYALMLARECGASQCRAIVIRLPEGEPPTILVAEFDAIDLDAIAGELRALVDRVESEREAPQLTLGEHCGWCPARYSCPAQTAVVQALVPMADRMGEVSSDKLGALWEQAASVEKLADRVRKEINARVIAGERIVLPDGRVLRASTVTRAPTTTKGSTFTTVRAVKDRDAA